MAHLFFNEVKVQLRKKTGCTKQTKHILLFRDYFVGAPRAPGFGFAWSNPRYLARPLLTS
jgi:hypothetical protein